MATHYFGADLVSSCGTDIQEMSGEWDEAISWADVDCEGCLDSYDPTPVEQWEVTYDGAENAYVPDTRNKHDETL